jgi:hypothetical protein
MAALLFRRIAFENVSTGHVFPFGLQRVKIGRPHASERFEISILNERETYVSTDFIKGENSNGLSQSGHIRRVIGRCFPEHSSTYSNRKGSGEIFSASYPLMMG